MTSPVSGRLDIDDTRRALENLLLDVNAALAPLEEDRLVDISHIPQPLLFICYSPRSGSTLVSQALAATGEFAYVSNFAARFWKAPAIAMEIEKSLNLVTNAPAFASSHGSTVMATDPHEFGFFWNEHIPYDEHSHFVPLKNFSGTHKQRLRRHVASMIATSARPFFFKNAIAGINAHYLGQVFPEAYFVIITRQPQYIGQSILLAREKLYNNRNHWWSLKPAGTAEIIATSADCYEEVARQVKSIYSGFRDALVGLEAQCMVLNYEMFCQQPIKEITRLFAFLKLHPKQKNWHKNLPESFALSNSIKMEKDSFDKLSLAMEHQGAGETITQLESDFSTT